MKKNLRIILFTSVFMGLLFTSSADRGAGKKRTTKAAFNIKMPSTFQSSLNFNLRNGLKYNGSFVSPNKTTFVKGTTTSNAFVTYQKGNSIYIVPYKQRIIIPVVKQGFVGAKLVIRLTK